MDFSDQTAFTFLDSLSNMFTGAMTRGGLNALHDEAMYLLLSLAAIEIALSVILNLDQDHFKYVAVQCLKIGFFVGLIDNWDYLTELLRASAVAVGVKAAVGSAAPPAFSPDMIVNVGMTIVSSIYGDLSVSDFLGPSALIKLIVMLLVLLCFLFMGLQVLITDIEFAVVKVLTIMLIPFGVFKQTRFLYEKAIGAVISFAIKFMVLYFITCIGVPLFSGWANQDDFTGFTSLLKLFCSACALAFLTWQAPSLVQGLLTGTPSLDGGQVMKGIGKAAATAATVATGAGMVAAAGGAAAAAGTGLKGTLSNLGTIARESTPFAGGMRNAKYLMEASANPGLSPDGATRRLQKMAQKAAAGASSGNAAYAASASGGGSWTVGQFAYDYASAPDFSPAGSAPPPGDASSTAAPAADASSSSTATASGNVAYSYRSAPSPARGGSTPPPAADPQRETLRTILRNLDVAADDDEDKDR